MILPEILEMGLVISYSITNILVVDLPFIVCFQPNEKIATAAVRASGLPVEPPPSSGQLAKQTLGSCFKRHRGKAVDLNS